MKQLEGRPYLKTSKSTGLKWLLHSKGWGHSKQDRFFLGILEDNAFRLSDR